jgi:hypothetical protein
VEREAALVVAVDELLARGLNLGQDAEPAERIDVLARREHAIGHRRAADAVEAVAAGDDLAAQLVALAVVAVAQRRLVGVDALWRHVLGPEQERRAGFDASGDQVLNDLLLAVNRDAAAVGQLVERDSVALAAEAQLNAVVHEPLPLEALAHAHLEQEVDGALLEHAGADAALYVVAVASLEDDRLDALEMQELPEHQARRPGSHDSDLRAGDVLCAHGVVQ